MMDDAQKTRVVSYSQYSMWANCPYQWKLAYVDKLKPSESSIHLVFGKAIHETIQEWLDILYNGEKYKSKFFDLEFLFKEKLLHFFKKDTIIQDEQKIYPCDQPTLKEFYSDGCQILTYIRKYQKDFFPTSGNELVGCEIPLEIKLLSKVNFIGYIDIVTRNIKTNQITIYDLKTSTKGWNYEKKDPKKINQILLYKHFYSKQFEVPLDLIDVQFIILKRKLNENNKWDIKRISSFEPSNGVVSINKAVKSFDQFISDAFDQQGNVTIEKLQPTPSTQACKFCIFNNKPELCSKSSYAIK